MNFQCPSNLVVFSFFWNNFFPRFRITVIFSPKWYINMASRSGSALDGSVTNELIGKMYAFHFTGFSIDQSFTRFRLFLSSTFLWDCCRVYLQREQSKLVPITNQLFAIIKSHLDFLHHRASMNTGRFGILTEIRGKSTQLWKYWNFRDKEKKLKGRGTVNTIIVRQKHKKIRREARRMTHWCFFATTSEVLKKMIIRDNTQ